MPIYQNIATFALRQPHTRSDARVVEEARLESVYTSKAYRGFESPSLRKAPLTDNCRQGALFILQPSHIISYYSLFHYYIHRIYSRKQK